MKKITLTFIVLFLAILSLQGNYIDNVTTTNQGFNYRYAQPIQFETRNLKFYVFPNGTFEFTRLGNAIAYGQRRYTNRRFGVSGMRSRYGPYYHGQRLVRNRYGDIIRIGRTPIIYDHRGRVRRIGPVSMHYGRFGFLRRIGDMQVRYNPRGKLIFARGHVLHDYCGICGIYGCTEVHFDNHDNRGWEARDWDHDRWYDEDEWDDEHWDDDDWEDRRKRKRKKRRAYTYDDD